LQKCSHYFKLDTKYKLQHQMPLNRVKSFLEEYSIALPLLILCGYIAAESYQVDYRAFYVAGKSILLGLDPYLNPVGQHPQLYSALNAEAEPFSAFRYPPIAAWCFAPLALMPYAISRFVFAFITFALLLAIASWIFRNHKTSDATRLALVLSIISLPAQAIFQRGQVDLILVMLALWSFGFWQRSPEGIWAPTLLATATALKVFPGILLIYFICQRQWAFLKRYLISTLFLFWLPYPFLGAEVYSNFARRSLPEIFGAIKLSEPINLLGQKTVFFGSANFVDALDGRGLIASRDYVGGAMNPLLFNHSLLAITIGCLGIPAMMLILRKKSNYYRYLAILNLINLANPLSWLMGLAWYLPFFFNHFPQASSQQRLILLAPLLAPPVLGLNGYLAIAITVLPTIQGLEASRAAERLEPEGASVVPGSNF